jgi:hypothetical protein
MNVVSAEAEWALERLVARLAEFLQLARAEATAPIRGRHVASHLSTHEVNALVDLVAIAESFSIDRLVRVRYVAQNGLQTWVARKNAWTLKASVDLTACPCWKALMGFVEARNAWQHGLGRLTDRQLGKHKQEVLGWLDAAAVRLNGDVLLVSGDDVVRCAGVCRDFIGWLDLAAPAR